MRISPRIAPVLLILLSLACSLLAQEQNDPSQQSRNAQRRLLNNIYRAPPGVRLNDQQKAKLAALREKEGAATAEQISQIRKKIESVYTPEQLAARAEATREARQAKKNSQQQRRAADAAVELSKAQRVQLAELRAEQQQMLVSVRQQINKLLGVEPRQRQAVANRPAPTQANVKYGPHQRNVLDFWQAKSSGPAPVLVSIHGGGFRGGNKSVNGALLRQCLDSGISVVAITYRFSQHAIAPASFTDSARAIQFIRHQAKAWNIDPSRLAATGGSAGAGISLWLGFHDDMADPTSDDPVLRQSTRLTCMFVNNGQSSYDPRFIRNLFPGKDTYRHSALSELFGVDMDQLDSLPADKYRLFEEVSAIPHLSKDDPPVILSYSRPIDVEVTNQSIGIHHAKFGQALQERMVKLGIRCDVQAGGKTLGGGPVVSTIDFLEEQFRLE